MRLPCIFYEVNPTDSEDNVGCDDYDDDEYYDYYDFDEYEPCEDDNEPWDDELDDEPWCDCDTGAIFSCHWFQDNCDTPIDGCDETRTGCGFIWAWNCDGICSII